MSFGQGSVTKNNRFGLSVFDDMISGAHESGNGYPAGTLFRGSGNSGGYIFGGNAGVDIPGVAGRFGIIGVGTGASNNSTGQGFLDAQSVQVYCGMAGITLQFGFKVNTLRTAGVDYVMELGFGAGYPSGGSGLGTNGAAIVYNGATSANFQAVTAANSVKTTLTSSVSVAANTWYNGKIYLRADGSGAEFYIASIGAAYVSLGTSTTNLPTSSFQTSPFFNIYKQTTAVATSSSFYMDWVQLDVNGLNR